jgi:hypothetical protein
VYVHLLNITPSVEFNALLRMASVHIGVCASAPQPTDVDLQSRDVDFQSTDIDLQSRDVYFGVQM